MAGVEPGNGYVGKFKKYWTKEEQVILVDALYDLRVSGRFVGADFTPEYVHAVRKLMGPDLFTSVKCVRNRMKNMKTDFSVVQLMLATSGFSWDPEKSRVVADDHVWDSYIKTHRNAAQWRTQPFPHYDRLCVIFGKDGATGSQTNGLEGERAVDENQISPSVEAKDLLVGGDVFSTQGVNETTGCKRKRYEVNDSSKSCVESLEKIKNAIDNFGRTVSENLEKVATQGVNATTNVMDKAMSGINDLPGLSLEERLKAMSVIGRSAPLFFMFDRLDGDEKIRMAQMVASGSIS